MIQMKSSVNKAIHNEFHFRYKSEWFFGFNGRCAMNRVRYITAMSLAFAFAACSDDGTTIKGNSCELPKVECSGTCTDLGAMHWSNCGVCAKGYEDADGDAANGCEATADGENPGGNSGENPECADPDEKKCSGTCTDLGAMHWSDCGVCAKGYEDADGDAANGCEATADGENPGGNSGENPECADPDEKKCSGVCVDLGAMHWSDCGVCAEGYEAADGDAANGCEAKVDGENPGENPECADPDEKKCSGACVDLGTLHWSDCGVCAVGYEDADGDAANGCEREKQPEPLVCNDEVGEKACSGACVDLGTLHWIDCGVCALGYADADGDAANGCEARVKLHDGRCVDATDCETLAHVATASCVAGKCQIDACAEGYADCDGNPKTGCEMNGSSNFYRCGARGTCTDATESANYKGKACNLGEECRDGACKPVPEIVGCSDGTREGFLDLLKFNNLAACSGAWTVKGIHHNEGPSCNRKSGNTGENQAGAGCNVEDLCATGWHVCLGRGDVATRSEYGCNGILDGMPQNEPYLFITRTSSTGELNCDPDTVGVPLNMNDIFGCGNFGCYATGNKCDPLKLSGHNLCQALREKCGCSLQANGTVACSNTSGHCNGNGIGHPIDYFGALNHRIYTPAWDCGNDDSGEYEARDIVKTSNDQGGVMCCKNQCEIDADCGAGRICRYNVCVECIINELGQTEGCPAGKTCSASHTCV